MTRQENSSLHDYAIGILVFCLLVLAGISVVLYGRFFIGLMFLFAGIVTVIIVILWYRLRKRQYGRLAVIIITAAACAVIGILAITIATDAIVHAGGVIPRVPGESGPVPSGPAPWDPPDADLLGRQLNDTAALLTLPVGGFEDGRVFVSSYYPEGFANYTLVTRNMTPTTVELRIFPVEMARSSAGHAPYEDLNVSITPDYFVVAADRSYTAQVRVNLTSGRYDETLKLLPYYVQARPISGDRIIADDWVLVYAGGAFVPGVSGFYRGRAHLLDSDRELTIKAGETGNATFLNQPGIGGTGFVQYNLSMVSGRIDMMPMREDEKRPFPQGMEVTISPNNYTARSFGYYPSVITVKTDPDLPPGDYHVLIEADGIGTNGQCHVHVLPPS
ncbi:MAG: hypothetical protein A4E35_01577 [Methanoregula sp. PtaU1.Bin051]|nr:MAG: hypothetical protein A4E35_01577 [Methanoregula sp. PtaU1.Bin051]